MIWGLWSACRTDDGITLGSLPEWLTMIVTALALAAAVFAGWQAKKAADSSRAQAKSAAEAVAFSQQQADAALQAVVHSAEAAASARVQADAAQRALEADIKIREEAQARLVFTTIRAGRWLEDGHPVDVRDTSVIYDAGLLSNPTRDATGKETHETLELGQQLIVTVHNSSAEILGGFTAAAVHRQSGESSKQGEWVDAVAPGEQVQMTFVIPAPGVDMMRTTAEEQARGWVASIQYRDSSGLWWSRIGADHIVKIGFELFDDLVDDLAADSAQLDHADGDTES